MHFEGDTEQYLNYDGEFNGENLSLPILIHNENLLIYFPFTDEMKAEAKESIIRLLPYFKFRNRNQEPYYIGGSGSIGRLDRELDRVDTLIYPKD